MSNMETQILQDAVKHNGDRLSHSINPENIFLKSDKMM